MSQEAVSKFLEDLQKDEALANALGSSGLERDGTIWGEELTQFASQNGYEFTVEELQAHSPGAQGAGELDEAALEGVAGGLTLSTFDAKSQIYTLNTSLTSFKFSPAANCYDQIGTIYNCR